MILEDLSERASYRSLGRSEPTRPPNMTARPAQDADRLCQSDRRRLVGAAPVSPAALLNRRYSGSAASLSYAKRKSVELKLCEPESVITISVFEVFPLVSTRMTVLVPSKFQLTELAITLLV